jgi:hypothetical protein
MKPKLNHKYSRLEIHKMLGGQLQHYLPHKNGRILCGCFDRSPTLNPDAPEEIIFGSNPEVSGTALIVYNQSSAIPVFLRDGPGQWEYVGNYRCVGYSKDSKTVKEKTKKYPKRKGIAGVLHFERA